MGCGCGGSSNGGKLKKAKSVKKMAHATPPVIKTPTVQDNKKDIVIQQGNLCNDPTFCTRAVTDPDLLCLNGADPNAYRIEFIGEEQNPGTNTTTLSYIVCSCGRPDISHFVFEICPAGVAPLLDLTRTRAANPGIAANRIVIQEVGTPANDFPFRNVKFDIGFDQNQCRTVNLVFQGQFTVEGSLSRVGIKAGQLEPVGEITGVAGICGCPRPICECPEYDNTFECTLSVPDCLTPVGEPRVGICSMGSSTMVTQCRAIDDSNCGDPELECPGNPNCRDRLHAAITIDVYVAQDYEDECGNVVSRCCNGRITVQKDCFACIGSFTGFNCTECEHLIIGTPVRNGNAITVNFDIDCASYMPN